MSRAEYRESLVQAGARAIWAEREKRSAYRASRPWEDASPEAQIWAACDAAAALDAILAGLKEPTIDMIHAGSDSIDLNDRLASAYAIEAKRTWQAMLATIAKEGE